MGATNSVSNKQRRPSKNRNIFHNDKENQLKQQDIESFRHKLIHNIETFVVNVYARCSPYDSCLYILNSELARDNFKVYLMNTYTNHEHYYIDLYIHCCNLFDTIIYKSCYNYIVNYNQIKKMDRSLDLSKSKLDVKLDIKMDSKTDSEKDSHIDTNIDNYIHNHIDSAIIRSDSEMTDHQIKINDNEIYHFDSLIINDIIESIHLIRNIIYKYFVEKDHIQLSVFVANKIKFLYEKIDSVVNKPIDKNLSNQSINEIITLYTDLTNLTTNIIKELIEVLSSKYFYQFLLSKEYKIWRSCESNHAIAATLEDTVSAISRRDDIMSSRQPSQVSTPIASVMGLGSLTTPNVAGRKLVTHRLSDFSFNAFTHLETSELSEVLGSENWLASLIAAAEGLPLALTIASATKRPGVGNAILFVNKQFQKLTGYSRSMCIGQNYKFLQCANTESNKIEQLVNSVKSHKQLSIVLTNQRRDQTEFKHLIVLKHINSDSNKSTFKYIICLHFDVTNDLDCGAGKSAILIELIDMLPGVILTDTVTG